MIIAYNEQVFIKYLKTVNSIQIKQIYYKFHIIINIYTYFYCLKIYILTNCTT